MGCSLEAYRAKIGTFGNSKQGIKIGSVKKEEKYQKTPSYILLLYIVCCILAILLPPRLPPAAGWSPAVPCSSAVVRTTTATSPYYSAHYSRPYRCASDRYAGGTPSPLPSPRIKQFRGIEQQQTSFKLPFMLSSKIRNKKVHTVEGNQARRGKPITICYWNKGSAFLKNKQEDISEIINTQKPLRLSIRPWGSQV